LPLTWSLMATTSKKSGLSAGLATLSSSISRTGDWPEYLAAIRSGAFDYLAYPPAPGELQRIIRNAFLERE